MKKLFFVFLISIFLLVGCSKNKPNTSVNTVSNEAKEEFTSYKSPEKPLPNKREEQLIKSFDESVSDGVYNYANVSEKAKTFLLANSNLFPSNEEIDPNYINWDLERKHITKDIQNVGDYLFNLSGEIINISSYDSTKGNGRITEIHLIDDNLESYDILYYGDIPEKYNGDYINIVGLPLAEIAYDNIGGGVTKSIFVLAASYN